MKTRYYKEKATGTVLMMQEVVDTIIPAGYTNFRYKFHTWHIDWRLLPEELLDEVNRDFEELTEDEVFLEMV